MAYSPAYSQTLQQEYRPLIQTGFQDNQLVLMRQRCYAKSCYLEINKKLNFSHASKSCYLKSSLRNGAS